MESNRKPGNEFSPSDYWARRNWEAIRAPPPPSSIDAPTSPNSWDVDNRPMFGISSEELAPTVLFVSSLDDNPDVPEPTAYEWADNPYQVTKNPAYKIEVEVQFLLMGTQREAWLNQSSIEHVRALALNHGTTPKPTTIPGPYSPTPLNAPERDPIRMAWNDFGDMNQQAPECFNYQLTKDEFQSFVQDNIIMLAINDNTRQ